MTNFFVYLRLNIIIIIIIIIIIKYHYYFIFLFSCSIFSHHWIWKSYSIYCLKNKIFLTLKSFSL